MSKQLTVCHLHMPGTITKIFARTPREAREKAIAKCAEYIACDAECRADGFWATLYTPRGRQSIGHLVGKV